MWEGIVVGLHRAPRSFLPMESPQSFRLIAGIGVEGDRYSTGDGFYSDRPHAGRQVTLFEVETLESLARDHGVVLGMNDHRRNITMRGVPLNHLVGKRFRVGEVVLEGERLAVPCRHIEQITGKDIFPLLIHRCGLQCIIMTDGTVHMHDRVVPLPA